ncbi:MULTISPECIES: carbon monoxide dehydrogenase subunit G [unclassified Paenibacillus]|uniref:SRPBCC family protein n=1 Tax=unclassified Paenibacillus TaxID=185978 RepID=UPI001AE565BE|nr:MULTISPECIES: carbon monoxide dehydrogenase subunit G [unclassified Paenibacillus]MBP1154460.1 carbon monoxide dehydrogenase subunit G [Paenibacillus sp. PvP091]MBP1170156.1 carbon monoxide dehydrogenase subunit G [Paenibacillus sp. PvR098]MBP2441184.1 carbon monoxide dehydrogenase subunit G [Paenibacillus sp. PvP052]
MKVQGEIVVEASQEDVWKALNDPEVLSKATPGCKALIEVEPDSYKAEIVLGIAAVRGEYVAEIQIFEKSAPNRYRLLMKADSKMGFVEGNAVVELIYNEPKTTIRYDGEAKVGGLVAGVGQRILSGIAKMIVKDFFKKIAKESNAKEVN